MNKPEETNKISISATAYQGRLIYPEESKKNDMFTYQNFFTNLNNNESYNPDNSYQDDNTKISNNKDKVDMSTILKNPLNFSQKQIERAKLPLASTKKARFSKKQG